MRGDRVIVKAFGNRPLLRRVWDVSSTKVYVLDEESFQRRQVHEDTSLPMAWRRDVVFCHDEKLFAGLARDYKTNPTLWKQLVVYQGDNGNNG